MFLRYNTRKKDGKEHRYFSIVENRRLRAGHTTQRTVLYLGEINDTQQAAWRKSLEVINETNQRTEQICLFPEDRDIPADVLNGLQIKLCELTLQRPRAFSATAGWGAGFGMSCNWVRSGSNDYRRERRRCLGSKCSNY